jgi:phage antirepressor YoqD-like protein
MVNSKPRNLIRLGNAAERLDVQQSTLRAWFLARKYLDWVKVGRAVCVTEESLERFIDSNTIPARAARQ